MSNHRKRIIRCISVGMVGLFFVGLIASWVVAGWLISSKPSSVGDPPADLPAFSISLASDSGATIAGWHIPAEPSSGVIVLLHSLRGSRLSMLSRARLFHAAGYSIVMIDLQAHGDSSGTQITLGELEKHDVLSAVKYAQQQHPNEPIGVVGISLGGASALLASPLGIDAMVLEAVFPSIKEAIHNRVAAKLGVLSSVPAELLLLQLQPRLGVLPSNLRPIDYVSSANCPIFFISGTEDLHTTSTETKQMFDIAHQPKELWLVEKAAHVDLYNASPEQYKKRVIDFFNQHLRSYP